MSSMVPLVKQAALEAMESAKPVQVVFGTVQTVSPLTIRIEQKLTLGEKNLILTRNVTDYTVEMTVDHFTEESAGGAGEAAFAAHAHPYLGRKPFLVHNALRPGERVLLLRMQQGRKFVVIDRLEGSA